MRLDKTFSQRMFKTLTRFLHFRRKYPTCTKEGILQFGIHFVCHTIGQRHNVKTPKVLPIRGLVSYAPKSRAVKSINECWEDEDYFLFLTQGYHKPSQAWQVAPSVLVTREIYSCCHSWFSRKIISITTTSIVDVVQYVIWSRPWSGGTNLPLSGRNILVLPREIIWLV